MEILFIVVLVAVCVWLLFRSFQAADDLDNLQTNFRKLENELLALREELSDKKPPATAATTPPRHEPAVPMRAAAALTPPRPAPTAYPSPPIIPPPPSIPPRLSVPPVPQAARPSRPGVDWEQLLGVKLAAWIGGFVLFWRSSLP